MTHYQQVYQGQFGEFTITAADRQEVVIYRTGLGVMALCFLAGTMAVLRWGADPQVLQILTGVYAIFCLSLGVSLVTIHIYLGFLKRFLQLCWGIGCVAAVAVAVGQDQPLALSVYQNPWALVGIGFTFVALNGIFFKEAFCFNRIETKGLTLLVPILLLGHLWDWIPSDWEAMLLMLWAGLFTLFVVRKGIQAIPPDIGDKSVFAYLKQQRHMQTGLAE